jgi:hypothetical protein
MDRAAHPSGRGAAARVIARGLAYVSARQLRIARANGIKPFLVDQVGTAKQTTLLRPGRRRHAPASHVPWLQGRVGVNCPPPQVQVPGLKTMSQTTRARMANVTRLLRIQRPNNALTTRGSASEPEATRSRAIALRP